jgi:zinc transporter ZupT
MIKNQAGLQSASDAVSQAASIPVRLPWILPLAAGVFLGAAVFEMLPQALGLAGGKAWLWSLGGFVAFILIHEGLSDGSRAGTGWVSSIGVWLHSFLEGIMAATGFAVSLTTGILVSVGLAIHLLPEALSLVALLTATGVTMRQALIRNGISFGLLAAGILLAGSFGRGLPPGLLGIALALGSGGLVYLAHLSWMERRGALGAGLLVAVAGTVLMGAVAFAGR